MSTILTPRQLVSNIAMPRLGEALVHLNNRVCVLISSVIIVHYSRMIVDFSSIRSINFIIDQQKVLSDKTTEEIIVQISMTAIISLIGNYQVLFIADFILDISKFIAAIFAIVWVVKINDAGALPWPNENNTIFLTDLRE
ncbi:MAG: hypothetical protein ACRBM6_25725 [Geminicoccales bacterium]